MNGKSLSCRLLNCATGLMLLLFVATTVMWVRSYSVAEEILWQEAQSAGPLTPCRPHVCAITVYSERGRLLVVVDVETATGGSEGPGGWIYEKNPPQRLADVVTDAVFDAPPRPPRFDHLGILIRRDAYPAEVSYMIAAPIWPMPLLLAVIPALWWKRNRRPKSGFCPFWRYFQKLWTAATG